MSNTIKMSDLLPGLALGNLPVIEQSSFYKIAKQRKAVYVSKTKTRVTRVDISGFTLDHPAVRPPAKKNGKVTGQVQMDHPLAMEALGEAFQILLNGEVVGDKFEKVAPLFIGPVQEVK